VTASSYQASYEVVEDIDVQEPRFFSVVLLNDDFTPMDFVVWVLQDIFHKSYEESQALMMKIHTQGKGYCGVFTYEVAETKVMQVRQAADRHSHPLSCILEEVSL